jgi:hypothetical protein
LPDKNQLDNQPTSRGGWIKNSAPGACIFMIFGVCKAG